MAGYDQKIKIKASFKDEARAFFNFLQKVGKRYSRSVKVRYRYLGRGHFLVMIDGGSGGIDAFFQELILNRGLYYYGCTLKNKREIINYVILPIYQQLIDCRFFNSKSRFMKKHILGKYSQKDFIPGNLKGLHGQQFEVAFRRWDLEIISNKEYIEILDSIFTDLMLTELNYNKGEKSPNFHTLLRSFKNKYIFNEGTDCLFEETHNARVKSLHRRDTINNKDYLYELSMSFFWYFEYLDDFKESQLFKCVYNRKGKKVKRFKYGTEIYKIGKELFVEDAINPCHDCGVKKGQFHVIGCDYELCPICGKQLLSCTHFIK